MEENKQKGFVKIYRSLLEWEWYTEPATTHLFLHLILKANFKDKRWKGKKIKRGQLATSLKNLSSSTGLSISKIRTSLTRLESSGEIVIKTTNKYTLIYIVGYQVYQELNIPDDKQMDNKKTTVSNQKTTTKELEEKKKKLIKKEERDNAPSNFEYLSNFYSEEINLILKRHRLPDREREFCIDKFNEKVYKNLNVNLFENYLTNWIKNLEKDGTMDSWRAKSFLKK